MGARTDAARAEVLARRGDLLVEVQRLEASARSAVDIPGKARRAPVKTAGLAAGTAFLALGGPKRIFRRARRAVLGPNADLPKSMLPKDIERAVKALGADGDKVRGSLEREFARYLEERSKARRNGDIAEVATTIVGNVLKPASARLGKQLAEGLLAPDSTSFNKALAKVRARYPTAGPAPAATEPAGRTRVSGRRARQRAQGAAEQVRSAARPPLDSRLGEWRNGRRAGLRSRCPARGVSVRIRPRLPPCTRGAGIAACAGPVAVVDVTAKTMPTVTNGPWTLPPVNLPYTSRNDETVDHPRPEEFRPARNRAPARSPRRSDR